MRATPFLCGLGLALCVTHRTSESQVTPVRITRDSLGTLPLKAPLAALVQRIPASKRVAWGDSDLSYPALAFRIGTLQVWAVQRREPPDDADTIPDLDLTKAADFYAIEGTGGVLPTGGLTGSTWGQLRPTLGPVVVYAKPGMPIQVRLCRYPWLVVGFASIKKPPRRDGTVAPTSIPSSARPKYFHLHPSDPAADPHQKCGSA